jgi:hypothetical protein
VAVLGDDLYCHQPFCQGVLAQGMYFLLVCKPDLPTLLYAWIDDFTPTGHGRTFERTRWNGKRRLTEHYRYATVMTP